MSTANRYFLTFVNGTNQTMSISTRKYKCLKACPGDNVKVVARARINTQICVQVQLECDPCPCEFLLPAATDTYTVKRDMNADGQQCSRLYMVPQSAPSTRIYGTRPSPCDESKDGQVADNAQPCPTSSDAWGQEAKCKKRRRRSKHRRNWCCEVTTAIIAAAVIVIAGIKIVT